MTAAWRNPPPERVTVFYHPRVTQSEALAHHMAGALVGRLPYRVGVVSLESPDVTGQVAQCDLAVVLGGDGSMLRVGRMAAMCAPPMRGPAVLGVNLGRLGFLAEVQPQEWPAALDRVLAGNFWAENRRLLEVAHMRGDHVLNTYLALNEAVVGRGALARPVRLKTLIDGHDFTTYVADGLILATPTGSTAYALAVGGPILPPDLANLLMLPIAPHLTFERALVLEQGVVVDVWPHVEHQVVLSVDGQHEEHLQNGDRVRAWMSRHVARFARVRPHTYFYASLMARMTPNSHTER